jgi:small conductance mechanosensitive channel
MNVSNIDQEILMTYAIEYGSSLIGAIAIFYLGRIVARVVTNLLRKGLNRANVDQTLVKFGTNVAYGILMAFVVIASISQLGVETTSLAAIIAAAGLAIGLALQGSLGNLAAGVMIILFRPFKAGDFVEVSGTAGSVSDVGIFTTTLKTPDNKTIIIPNSSATGSNIINYSTEATRRVDMVFGIGYGDDIKKAKQVLSNLVQADSRILKDPAPQVAVSELADSSVNFVVRPWVNAADYWAVKFDFTEAVKETFDKEGISIPFPQQDVHMHNVVSLEDAKKKAA